MTKTDEVRSSTGCWRAKYQGKACGAHKACHPGECILEKSIMGLRRGGRLTCPVIPAAARFIQDPFKGSFRWHAEQLPAVGCAATAARSAACARGAAAAASLGVQPRGRRPLVVIAVHGSIVQLADFVVLHRVAHRLKAQVQRTGCDRVNHLLLRQRGHSEGRQGSRWWREGRCTVKGRAPAGGGCLWAACCG